MSQKRLDEIAEVFSGVQTTRFQDDTAQSSAVIKNKFVERDILEYSMENISKDINKKYFSKKGDIIISLSQPNKVSLIKSEGYIIPMYFAVIRLKKGHDSSFIYHLLNSEGFHKQLHSFLEGGSLKIIKVNDLKTLKLNIPDLSEQKKYGEFLDLIDKKNKILEDKKKVNEKLKEYLIQTQSKGE